ncbi:MAG TPA: PilZ domain-containing protein [Tepidisphaeraceae bacterium]|jgi:c-di-GMP-binding flagellar brake protein YcgR
MTLLYTEPSDELIEAGELHSERRRGLRIRQARPCKIFEPAASRYYGGQTADISATGLRIELPASAPITEGEILSIHVGPSATGSGLANRRQMMPARVVWVERNTFIKTGRMFAGVEFLSSISAQLHAA